MTLYVKSHSVRDIRHGSRAVLQGGVVPLTVTPLPGLTFGSVIEGVDVRELSDGDWRTLRYTWHDRGIIVVKDSV